LYGGTPLKALNLDDTPASVVSNRKSGRRTNVGGGDYVDNENMHYAASGVTYLVHLHASSAGSVSGGGDGSSDGDGDGGGGGGGDGGTTRGVAGTSLCCIPTTAELYAQREEAARRKNLVGKSGKSQTTHRQPNTGIIGGVKQVLSTPAEVRIGLFDGRHSLLAVTAGLCFGFGIVALLAIGWAMQWKYGAIDRSYTAMETDYEPIERKPTLPLGKGRKSTSYYGSMDSAESVGSGPTGDAEVSTYGYSLPGEEKPCISHTTPILLSLPRRSRPAYERLSPGREGLMLKTYNPKNAC
jgi:hypothetical protein